MIKQFFFHKPHFFNISVSFFCLLIVTGIFMGCNDDPYQIGLELLPPEDFLSVYQDTLTIEAYTIGPVGIHVYDSVNIPFGIYVDPIFGQTTASFMVEFSPGNNYIKIDSGLVVDSVVFTIYYDALYGDSLYRPQLEVYRVTDRISKSEKYKTDYDITGKINPENLALTLTQHTDSIKRLRLKLSPEIGEELINALGANDSLWFTNYKIDSVFDANFKGLYLVPKTENAYNGLLNINSIFLTVGLRTDTDTSLISFAYIPGDKRYLNSVPMGDKYIKIIDHDYSNSAIGILNDYSTQDTALYLESLGGTHIILKIPYLEHLKQSIGRVSVNSAELFFPVLSDSADFYGNYPPLQLGMRISGTEPKFVPDDILQKTGGYGSTTFYSLMNGRFNANLWGYKFILTRYFHEYMKGNISSNQLEIFAAILDPVIGGSNYNPIKYTRSILAGTNNPDPDKKIILKVAYTKLD